MDDTFIKKIIKRSCEISSFQIKLLIAKINDVETSMKIPTLSIVVTFPEARFPTFLIVYLYYGGANTYLNCSIITYNTHKRHR